MHKNKEYHQDSAVSSILTYMECAIVLGFATPLVFILAHIAVFTHLIMFRFMRANGIHVIKSQLSQASHVLYFSFFLMQTLVVFFWKGAIDSEMKETFPVLVSICVISWFVIAHKCLTRERKPILVTMQQRSYIGLDLELPLLQIDTDE